MSIAIRLQERHLQAELQELKLKLDEYETTYKTQKVPSNRINLIDTHSDQFASHTIKATNKPSIHSVETSCNFILEIASQRSQESAGAG